MTDTEVTQANGKLHNLFPRPEAEDALQSTDQPEPAEAEVRTGHNLPDSADTREERRRLRTRMHGAITHRHTRFALRHGAYVAAGVHVVAKRTWEARTTATHQRAIDAARLKGDHASMLEWTQEAARFREQRHKRRMELLSAPYHLVKGTVFGGTLTVGGLIALGIMLAIVNKNVRNVFAPLLDALRLVKFIWTVCGYLYVPVALSLPVLLAGWLWANGKNRGAVPNWLMPENTRAVGEVITPSIIVKAMRDLGISKLTAGIRELADGAASLLGPICIAGCGVEVDFMLPSGVSTAEIQAKRRRLAENCHRHEHELFVTIPRAARTVRLWIADAGALDEPIGPSPLVTDPTTVADYRGGRAPWGQDLRGDAALISLFQRHVLVTGLSNQGKTASLRALALWLALCVRVRFWIADFKGVGDWLMFEGLAEVLIQGPTDECVMEGTHMVEAGVVEMHRRLDLMKELTARGWSQDKILADPRFAPLVLIVDEAQVAYASAVIGEDKRPYGGQRNVSRYFQAIKKIHDQGRAVSVTTWEGTQDPTDRNLPKTTREGNHIRASLVVGTEAQAQMALGEAAVNGGAAPHRLRQGMDKGTLVVAGDGLDLEPGQTSITVRTHYIGPEDAREIAERAKELRARSPRGQEQEEAQAGRDLLADVLEVCGDEKRVRTSVVIQRLAALDPDAYEGYTGEQLKAVLDAAGAAPHRYNGNPVVTTARVQAALDERENDDSEPEDDEF